MPSPAAAPLPVSPKVILPRRESGADDRSATRPSPPDRGMKFLITAGDFDALSGGGLALHLLCDLLNRSGTEAYICEKVQAMEVTPTTAWGGLGSVVRAWARWHFRQKRRRLVTAPDLRTPVLRDLSVVREAPDWIVIYPEIIYGNPLVAKNVVRWFLHHPGYFRGQTGINRDELHVRYSDWQRLPQIEWCHAYPGNLRPFKVPACYTPPAADAPRSGTAYCLRKGAGRPIVHDLRDSVLIDPLNHAQTAEVFRRVKTFISYDLYTAYSSLAVLCGADSVVVPDPSLTETQWYANEEDRWGLAYGFDRLEAARATAARQRARRQALEADSLRSVAAFAAHARAHFQAPARKAASGPASLATLTANLS